MSDNDRRGGMWWTAGVQAAPSEAATRLLRYRPAVPPSDRQASVQSVMHVATSFANEAPRGDVFYSVTNAAAQASTVFVRKHR